MPGRKQHFIPQFLLKEFGWRQKRKTYVNVFREQQFYTSPTEDVATARDFYSTPSSDTIITLDDKITQHEEFLIYHYKNFLLKAHQTAVNSDDAAKLVSHLCVRLESHRKAFIYTGKQMISELDLIFSDPNKAFDFLGLRASQPTQFVRDELEKIYYQHQFEFQSNGMSKESSILFQYSILQEKITTIFSNSNPELSKLLVTLKAKISEEVLKGHRNALEKSLVPHEWIKCLTKLNWRILDSETELILPDCIAISVENGVGLPLGIIDKQSLNNVILPLSPRKLLLGSGSSNPKIPVFYNSLFAMSCWDFFITNNRLNNPNEYQQKIQTHIKRYLNQIVQCNIVEYKRNGAVAF